MGSPNYGEQKPKQYVIMQDPNVADATVGASSQNGQYAKTAIPESGNDGDLVPFIQNKASTSTTMTDKDLYEFRTGGLANNAEWGWKEDTDASDQYRGFDDPMFIQNGGQPFGATDGYGYGNCIALSKRFNRVILIKWASGTGLELRYRDLDADMFTWTSGTISLTRPIYTGTTSSLIVGCVELPDGSMRLFVEIDTATESDFDMYKSLDGGITWSLAQTEIFKTYAGASGVGSGESGFVWGSVDISGDWVRISVIENNTTSGLKTVNTLVSGDRCATFKQVTSITDVTENGRGSTAGTSVTGRWCFDMVGTGTADGGFYLVVLTNSTSYKYCRYSATADGAWVLVSDLGWFVNDYPAASGGDGYAGTSNNYLLRSALFCDGSFVFEVTVSQIGTGAADYNVMLNMMKIPVSQVQDINYLQNLSKQIDVTATPKFGGIFYYKSLSRFEPDALRIKQVGDKAILMMGLSDPFATPPGQAEDASVVMYIRGWTRKSIRTNLVDDLKPQTSFSVGTGYSFTEATLFSNVWQSAFGSPWADATTGPDSANQWAATVNGSHAKAWTTTAVSLTASGVGDSYVTSKNDVLQCLNAGGKGIAVFRVYVESDYESGQLWSDVYTPNIGMKVHATDSGGSEQSSVSVAINSGGAIELRDHNAYASGEIQVISAVSLATVIPEDATFTLKTSEGSSQTFTAKGSFYRGDINFNAPPSTANPANDVTLTLVSSDGTSITYTGKLAGENISDNEFKAGPSFSMNDIVQSLLACINDTTYGHGGKLYAYQQSATNLRLYIWDLKSGNSTPSMSTSSSATDWGNAALTDFSGGGTVPSAGQFDRHPILAPSGDGLSTGGVTVAAGGTADEIAASIKTSIESTLPSKFLVTLTTSGTSPATISLQQLVAGVSGNTSISSSSTPTWPTGSTFTDFTGGFYDTRASAIRMGGFSFSGGGLQGTGKGYADIRLAFTKEDGISYVQISAASNSGMGERFRVSEKVPIGSLTGGSYSSSVVFGNIATTTTGSDSRKSYWKSVYLDHTTNYDHMDFINPTNMRGATVSPYELYLSTGVYTKWGGAAGFMGDTWNLNVGYNYPREAVKVLSPNVRWRSSATSSLQYVEFNGSDTAGLEEIRADGVAVFGTNFRYCYVDMAATNSPWPSAVAATAAITPGSPNDGDWVEIESTDGTALDYVVGTIESLPDRVFGTTDYKGATLNLVDSLKDCISWNGGAEATLQAVQNFSSPDSITLISTDGTSVTYTAAAAEDLPNNKFYDGGSTASSRALALTSLKACIENAAGHAGKITVTQYTITLTSDALKLVQATGGADGNRTIITVGVGTTPWLINGTSSSSTFMGGSDTTLNGKVTAVVAGSTVNLTQVTAGLAGNNTLIKSWSDVSAVFTGFSGGLDGTASGELIDCAIDESLTVSVVRSSSIVVDKVSHVSGGTETTTLDIFRDGQLKGFIANIISGSVIRGEAVVDFSAAKPSDGDTITIISTDGTSVTYTAKNGTPAIPEFDVSGTTVQAIKSFAAAIDNVSGHNGKIVCSSGDNPLSPSATKVTLIQAVGGSASNTAIDTAGTWTVPSAFSGGDDATSRAFRISHNYGRLIHFEGLTTGLSSYSTDPVAVNDIVTIVAPFGLNLISDYYTTTYSTVNKYMRIWVPPATAPSQPVATAQIILNHFPINLATVTITSTDGTVRTYMAVNASYTPPANPANGTFLNGFGVGKEATIEAIKACIEHPNGHGGKIVMSISTTHDTGDTLNLVQRHPGADGNVAMVTTGNWNSVDFIGFSGAADFNPAPENEDYFSIGSVVAGPVVGFSVPISWESSEENSSNVETKTLPNGMRINYKLGPPRRSFTGSIDGDALDFYPSTNSSAGGFKGFRRMFRDMVNTFGEYQERPMCLVLDGDSIADAATDTNGPFIADKVMYCTYSGTVSLDDEAWDTSATNKYRVGNMGIKFEEEV